jgi:hypothetical protein
VSAAELLPPRTCAGRSSKRLVKLLVRKLALDVLDVCAEEVEHADAAPTAPYCREGGEGVGLRESPGELNACVSVGSTAGGERVTRADEVSEGSFLCGGCAVCRPPPKSPSAVSRGER